MKEIAVIILNWNGRELLEQFIPAAVEHTISPLADLIVADNGSTDDSLAFLRENYPEVKILEFDKNYGFAEGYNLAIQRTRYRFTVLLNSDVEVTPGWLSPLYEFMVSFPYAGACSPKIRSWKNRQFFEYAGAAGGYIDKNGYPYCRGRLFNSLEQDLGQYDRPYYAPVAWASGAALMVDTELYLRLGGLDKSFFAHMEEIDLSLRMQGDGRGVYVVTSSMVYHVGGASLSRENPRKTYLNFRNNLLMLYKNSPKIQGRRRLLKRRLLDTLAWGMFLLKGEWKNAAAVMRAHFDFRKMRSQYISLPEKDFIPNLPGTNRNIVKDYYFLNKKK